MPLPRRLLSSDIFAGNGIKTFVLLGFYGRHFFTRLKFFHFDGIAYAIIFV
jgi:hypothetical protein